MPLHELEAELRIQIVSLTEFFPPEVPWSPDMGEVSENSYESEGQMVAEFAGRACYQSWDKPNPATATNDGYIRHILEVGHLSVLEHASVGFYFEGISRSLTHELVRHRHFSYSQLSQRYVPAINAKFVRPPAFSEEQAQDLGEEFRRAVEKYDGYNRGVGEDLDESITGTSRRKQARQAARAVLPNDTETKMVMTGNYRAWRHFVKMRATEHADVEIRRLAVEVLLRLKQVAPSVFHDFVVETIEDGSRVAYSILGTEIDS